MSDKLYVSIANLFQCPGCANKVQTPAVVCSNGHATCTICSIANLSCLMCGSIFVSNNHILINSILEATKNKENFLEKLIQTLECPVCYNQMRNCCMCANGHGICSNCRRFTKYCPLCRDHYVYNYSSLISMLLLILQQKIDCTNWSECRTSCLYSELSDHETSCNKTFCYCILNLCKWKGPCAKLSSHVFNYHPKQVVPENSVLQFSRFLQKKCLLLEQYGKSFWIIYERNTNGFNLAIQIHDLRCDYEVQIILVADKSEMKLTQNILTMRENVLEAMKFGNCLRIPNEIVNRFYDDKNSKCYITILKKNTNNNQSGKYQSLTHQIMAILFVLNVLLFCTKVR